MNTMTTMRSTLELILLAVCLGLAVNTVALSTERLPPAPDGGNLTLQIVEQPATPVLSHGMPGTEGIRYGFEGGCVLKLDNAYHLFVSEMVDDPFWVKMKLAHWSSPDGRKWQPNVDFDGVEWQLRRDRSMRRSLGTNASVQ